MSDLKTAADLMERCKLAYESAKREFERANTALFYTRRNYDDALGAYIELLKNPPKDESEERS